MQYAWIPIFLIISALLKAAPAVAHEGYENTPARDCCGIDQGNQHCQEAKWGYLKDGYFHFGVRENPHDADSAVYDITVPAVDVQRLDLFYNGAAHWCGRLVFDEKTHQLFNKYTYCAFAPPDRITDLVIPFIDALARVAVWLQFGLVLP